MKNKLRARKPKPSPKPVEQKQNDIYGYFTSPGYFTTKENN